jgi:hypothetical protein
VVVLIGFFSMFVHEGVHYFFCVVNGGSARFVFLSPFEALQAVGFFGIVGAIGTVCSVEYWSVFWKELIAYSVQFVFVGLFAWFSFRVILS